MKPIRLLTLAALFLTIHSPAGANDRNRQTQQRANQQRAEREKKRDERRTARDKVKGYMEDLDTNKDNSLSREEFINGESDKDGAARKFDEFNKNKDRALSKSEIEEMLGF